MMEGVRMIERKAVVLSRELDAWSHRVRCDRCGGLHTATVAYTWSDGYIETVCLPCAGYDGADPRGRKAAI